MPVVVTLRSVMPPLPVTVSDASDVVAPTVLPKVTVPVPEFAVRACVPAVVPLTVLQNSMVPPTVESVRLAVSVTAPSSSMVPAPVAVMLEPMEEVL